MIIVVANVTLPLEVPFPFPLLQDLRRKAARLVAAKCTLAARVDSFHESTEGKVRRGRSSVPGAWVFSWEDATSESFSDYQTDVCVCNPH